MEIQFSERVTSILTTMAIVAYLLGGTARIYPDNRRSAVAAI